LKIHITNFNLFHNLYFAEYLNGFPCVKTDAVSETKCGKLQNYVLFIKVTRIYFGEVIDYLLKDFTETYVYFTAYNCCIDVRDMNNPI